MSRFTGVLIAIGKPNRAERRSGDDNYSGEADLNLFTINF